MNNDTIHIACGFDSKYIRFAGVLLVSIFEKNKREQFCWHLMGLDLFESDKSDLSPRMSLCNQNGINADNFYFNAGMLLIDCNAWRENNTINKCLEYLKEKHPMHLDQDTLNAVLQDKWFHLSYRWNFMADFHGAYFLKKEFEIDMTKSYPYYLVIIHFTGVKPWHHANRSTYKLDFFRYQSLTKWKDIINSLPYFEREGYSCYSYSA